MVVWGCLRGGSGNCEGWIRTGGWRFVMDGGLT